MYYLYTDFISFEPLGSQGIEPAPACGPSDAKFRGYPCPPREVLYLARCLNLHALPPCSALAICNVLVDRLSAEIISSMTPENVIEEVFCGLPPCVSFLLPLTNSLITKPAQLMLSIEGWRSSG